MKKSILVFGIAVASFATFNLVSPELFAKSPNVVMIQQDGQGKEITFDDLPQAVQKAWASTKKDGDMINKITETTSGSEVTYTIEYKTSSGQAKTAAFDSKGKAVDSNSNSGTGNKY